ncbi:Pkinase-domain-containing protein [Trichodelitschia bisporula]|uniref:non-specific serine/threonine protein kinase n=1 Tax=Trichodelitschia bisporula TaxID=703511 RepID=A0A6G1I9Y7_9PEZI|nr:Pkinase-domain-containing protein [Trichodelitschia bisporula]
MVMSPLEDNGANQQQPAPAEDSRKLAPPSGNNVSSVRITKNYSTSNLASIPLYPPLSISTNKARHSFDANAKLELLTKSPIIPEHAGEHGLGLSGLRRIRQPPQASATGWSPGGAGGTSAGTGGNTAPTSRSGSLNLGVPASRVTSAPPIPSGPASPVLNTLEDLNRFPSESLHSFSFAHQSEDSIHNRQNVLKRSIDFMRDKLGWSASNPGLVAAQARLTGDQEVQSVIELLSRANLIGTEDPEPIGRHHGLYGRSGSITGPADLASGNVFDRSFAIPRSESPVSLESESPLSPPHDPEHFARKMRMVSGSNDGATRVEGETTLASIAQATTTGDAGERMETTQSRSLLKRTLTDVDDFSLAAKLTDTLAQPFSVNDNVSAMAVTTSAPPIIPPGVSHAPLAHGHGNRWVPAAQAIFTTEATAPWTITAANDLACLVFGVTRAEVRKLGILEVVRPERRKWLEEKLRDPEGGSLKGKGVYSQSQRASPNSTTSLNVGNGITARLLSKPSSRQSAASKRRSQTDDGIGSSYTARSKRGGPGHTATKSRGVLLCGDVVPIQKRNGALGSASLWVKEKKGGLIWVLEEIAEDIVYVSVDEVGCVSKVKGATEAVWGNERVRPGMDLQRLIPSIPRIVGTNTGALDYDLISELRTFTARTSNTINVPVTVDQLSGSPTFRVSSFPHIAGIMVVNSQTLHISSSNTVFSAALFGQAHPEGLHINQVLPGFDRVLRLMTDEDKIRLVDGIVIPEHSFRRARALLAMREGKADAALFLRPSGLPALHRDGSEIMVDVQMRVVKSTDKTVRTSDEQVLVEVDEDEPVGLTQSNPHSEVVYALWITYSRQMHAANHGVGPVTPRISRPSTPPHQPSPGQLTNVLPPPDETQHPHETPQSQVRTSLLTEQLAATTLSPGGEVRTRDPSPEPDNDGRKKTINDFVVLEDMGQGAYGQVKLCRYRRGNARKVVIKYVTKRRILVDTWTRDRRLGTVPLEIHVLDYLRRDGLRHQNIVEMADFFEDDTNYYIEMVPHGLPGMDLFDYIELRVNMEEAECRKIFVQVAEAVWHLHIRAKVVHRDIKDENVILDGEGNIKLIDFGSAAYIKNGPFDVFVGTIDYAAPEVLGGQSYRGKEQDVWALGILLYTIIYKENPFYSIDEIMDHDLRVPYVVSDASIDLVRLMLNRDVDQRITIGEVLEHPWCKGAGAEGDGG